MQCGWWYHSVQNLLSSRLLSKDLKIKIYRTVILPVVLYGCEAWSLTLREERRLRVFENWVLRRVFGPKRIEVTGECCTPEGNALTSRWALGWFCILVIYFLVTASNFFL
jgi:hypothetical protein